MSMVSQVFPACTIKFEAIKKSLKSLVYPYYKLIIKYFAKFTGKHLCQSLFYRTPLGERLCLRTPLLFLILSKRLFSAAKLI